MKKIKVKMLDSIAGLADPKPTAELDEKYKQKMAQMNKGRRTPFSKQFEEEFVGEMKKRDRYGEKAIGFSRDWAFKPGDEVLIHGELAQKWEDAGICMIVNEEKKAA